MAEIISIVVRPSEKEYQDRMGPFIRDRQETATLVAGFGLEGDAKAGKHPDRQVNILSQEWLAQVASQGYQVFPGSFGEQLTIAGLPLETLVPGDRLQLGKTAVVEITQARTGCDRLVAAQGKKLAGLGGHVGMLASVVTGGLINAGDVVRQIK